MAPVTLCSFEHNMKIWRDCGGNPKNRYLHTLLRIRWQNLGALARLLQCTNSVAIASDSDAVGYAFFHEPDPGPHRRPVQCEGRIRCSRSALSRSLLALCSLPG